MPRGVSGMIQTREDKTSRLSAEFCRIARNHADTQCIGQNEIIEADERHVATVRKKFPHRTSTRAVIAGDYRSRRVLHCQKPSDRFLGVRATRL